MISHLAIGSSSVLLPAYYLSFLSLSLTRSPSQMSIFLENGLICCDASFPHYALTPKNPVNYAITPKIRPDYALRHYALHFPHYAITQKNWANYALRNQKKGLLRHYANLYPPPLCSVLSVTPQILEGVTPPRCRVVIVDART